MQKLPILKSHPECTSCPLSSLGDLEHPGLCTRVWAFGHSKPLKSRAILLLGAYPGRHEDLEGKAFYEKMSTGIHAHYTYVKGVGLDKYADIYMGNAVRCYPRDETTVTEGMVGKCRQWLIEDLKELHKFHKEIIVIACGEKAVTSVLGKGQALKDFPQGTLQEIDGVPVRVFATRLPAMLLPGRDPSQILAIREHLFMVERFLRTGRLHERAKLPKRLVGMDLPDPPANVGRVILDIETYGYLETMPPQTVFHAKKSMVVDKVPADKLIALVGLTWWENGEQRHKVYRWSRMQERLRFISVLRRIKKLVIVGQNLMFDIPYLWAAAPALQKIIVPFKTTLIELMVVSFLQNDQRVERSLKSQVVVQGIDDYYDEEVSIKRGERFASVNDPRFHNYNIKDTANTGSLLLLYEDLLETMYPGRWTEDAMKWFSDVLWLAIEMSWNGIKYNKQRLHHRHQRYLSVELFLEAWARTFQVPVFNKKKQVRELKPWALRGEGSMTQLVPMMGQWFQRHTPRDRKARNEFMDRIEMTDKGAYSTKQSNVNLLLGVVPPDCQDRIMLRILRKHRSVKKILDSYTVPLLHMGPEGDPNTALCGTMAFPSWHVVPSSNDDDPEAGEGGTKQGRMTCRNPALQTQPKAVEHCQCSRFPGGALIYPDESQIELRVPAAYSGDQNMLKVFRDKINLHAKTGALIAGHAIDKRQHPVFYAGGKTLNFARIFGAREFKIQATLLADLELQVTLEWCRFFLKEDRKEYPRLYEWQAELIEEAREQGYLQVPLVGIARTFLGDIDQTYIPTILNFKVQTTAALVTQSAQIAICKELRKQGARSLMVSNTYDEGVIDSPPDEVEQVAKMAADYFTNPPIWGRLLDAGLHEVPLDVGVEIRYNSTEDWTWRQRRGAAER